jgi:transposase
MKKKSKELEMSQIKEILRLHESGITDKTAIASAAKTTRKTVALYIQRAKDSGLGYEELKTKSSREIRDALFPAGKNGNKSKPRPDFEYIYKECKEKNVTLQQLWCEYIADTPDGCNYANFCIWFNRERKKLNPSMRQVHKYGEKCFVDFTGTTVPITSKLTGEVFKAEIFVAVLGASNYTFAFAVESQKKHNWLDCHVRMFEFFGGVTEIVVPDNLKSGIDKTCRYDPLINRSYQELAEHYGVAVLPARPRKPKDKSKVEKGVQVVTNWILKALRNHTFFSVEELNEAIEPLLEKLNSKPFQQLPGSRREQFEKYEKPKLKPLPRERFEFNEWKQAKVNIDYHVELDGHYYSVPYKFIREKVEICFNARIVKIFKDSRVIASHRRNFNKGQHSTIPEHRPKAHEPYFEWAPERFVNWANNAIGPITSKMLDQYMKKYENQEITYRKCLGIIRIAKKYPKTRLEAASARLLEFGIGSNPYQSIKSMLAKNLDQQPLKQSVQARQLSLDSHENIRGPESFTGESTKEKNNDDK